MGAGSQETIFRPAWLTRAVYTLTGGTTPSHPAPKGLSLSLSLLSRSLYLASCVERLSEKGYEQNAERGIGRRKEAKMGRKVPLRCSVRLHRSLLRPFSDRFPARFASWGFPEVPLETV